MLSHDSARISKAKRAPEWRLEAGRQVVQVPSMLQHSNGKQDMPD